MRLTSFNLHPGKSPITSAVRGRRANTICWVELSLTDGDGAPLEIALFCNNVVELRNLLRDIRDSAIQALREMNQ